MEVKAVPEQNLIDLATGIVSAQVSHNCLPMGELPTVIQRVYDQLGKLGEPARPEPEKPVPPIPIKKTVTPNHIISLEDGKPYKTLR